MAKKRVFISHSAKETETKSFLDSLFIKLSEDPTLDVLVDKERLKTGCSWRDEIYTWMGLCHGAVILLSESAIKDSIWVSRESSILLWRRTLDPNFVVIPVYLGEVKTENVKQEMLFKDLNLTEIQGVPQNNTEDMIEEIKNSLLDKLKSSNVSTPLDEIADQIVDKLKDVDDKYIEKALCRLNKCLNPWLPNEDPRRLLALSMIHGGLEKFTDIMGELLIYLDYEKADLIFHLVEPSWVDICAARWIPDCAMHEEHKRALILNAAKNFFSARMYVRRASCLPPKYSWKVYEFSGVFGSGGVDEIAAEIEKGLAVTLLNPSNYTDESEKQKQLKNLLSIYCRKRQPVFVALKYSKMFAKLLPELQKKLPLVTFFLLSEENDFPDIEDLGGLHYKFLKPPLEPGKEDLALTQNNYVYSIINPKI